MGKANGQDTDESLYEVKSASTNTYLMPKRLWKDMYGDIQDKLQNAYRLVATLSAVMLI